MSTREEIIEMLETEWRDRLKAAVLAEREACEKVCEAHAKAYLLIQSPVAKAAWAACIDIRDAIRAKGEV